MNNTLAGWLGRDVTQGEELTLAKLAGENILRVLSQAEAVAAKMKSEAPILQTLGDVEH